MRSLSYPKDRPGTDLVSDAQIQPRQNLSLAEFVLFFSEIVSGH